MDGASSGKFLAGGPLTEAIASITEDGTADLAVAFWGRGVHETLRLPQDASALRVACDARSGACNPLIIQELLARGAQVVDVPRLHAKVYIGTGSVVIASANASANGLGEEGTELDVGLEAGYLSTEKSDISEARTWFDKVFAQGTQISNANLKEIAAIWKRRRGQRFVRLATTRDTFLGLTIRNPEWLINRPIKVIFYEPGKIPRHAEEVYKHSIFYDEETYDNLPLWPFYYGVKGLSRDDLVLDFAVSKQRVTCTGVWCVQGVIAKQAVNSR